MAGGCHGGGDHPVHRATRDRTAELVRRCRDLEARLAEHVL
jgi:BMFP domain-containing protein YqiC